MSRLDKPDSLDAGTQSWLPRRIRPLPYPLAFLSATPESLKIPLAMLIVIASARLLDEVFENLNQPGLVGQILAGVVIGPSVLNWLQPTDFLAALAELGVLFLLFRVGLEVKPSELFQVGRTALLVGVLGVIVPFIFGWGLLLLWGNSQIEAVFTGAALVATSVGITAQVLAAKGLLQERASRIIMAAAIIDDVLGLLILALVSGVAKGNVNVAELLSTAGLAIGFTVIVVLWGPKAVSRILPALGRHMKSVEGQFALAMVVLFALSVLALYAGVAAIIGAFLAGMVLSESVGHRVHDLTQGATELLIPFFLAGIGLHFNLAAFANWGTMALALAVLVAAVVSKLLGCGLGAYALGRRDAIRVGVGMVPRGEVGMIVAQIGASLGVIGDQVFAVVVFMSVVTTILAPPMLKSAYRDASPGAI
jgi:Kef-type K+ transport system membrane component KefB